MRRAGGLIAALMLLAAGAGPAFGAATRAEYVAQTDPICETGQRDMKREAKRQSPSIKKIAATLQQEDLSRERENALLGKLAAKEFSPTLKIFPRVTTQIAAVAPIATDQAAITQWLDARRTYSSLISRAIRAARVGKTPPTTG